MRLLNLALSFILLLVLGTASAAAFPGVPALPPPVHVTTVHGRATICQEGERDQVHARHSRFDFVRNAYWNGRGKMCLHSNGGPNFTVRRMPARNPKGYVLGFPDIGRGWHWGHGTPDTRFPVRVDHIKALTSRLRTPRNPHGTYNKAFDIWFNKTAATTNPAHYNGTELMVWNGWHGHCCWTANHRTKVKIDHVWYWRYHTVVYDHSAGNYYGGLKFHWNYMQYRRVQRSNRVHVNLAAFIRDAERQGVIFPRWYLQCVEYGFEIWKGGVGLRVRGFQLHLRVRR